MADGTDLVPGDVLDKYRLERLLGRGGMGEVWAAHDPDLDRKIALKVLNRALAGDDDAQARLQREGRAMARLRHPNVITVHDAMFRAGRGLIAMELVDGESLAAWLIRRRPHDEIMRVLLAAGRGLAAAHAAGMIHRDFKPHNVLVDRDGRVIVTDFGLARASGDSIPPPGIPVAAVPTAAIADGSVSGWAAVDAGAATMAPEIFDAPTQSATDPSAQTVAAPSGGNSPATDETIASSSPTPPSGKGDLSTPLTQTGALLGTPAYMAPEQLDGRTADARADQFAFCVTTWEAFAGERPFRGKTVEELTAAVGRGEPGGGDRVPRRLRALLARGLTRDPAGRWPRMSELLVALDRAWRRPRRVRIAAIIAGAALALAVVLVLAFRRGDAPIAGCGDGDGALATAWSPAIRADLATRIAGRPDPDRSLRFFDRWADKWRRTRTANCARPSDPEFSARRACLDAIAGEVAAKLELRASVPPAIFSVDVMARRLPAPEACATDPRNLPPAPPAPEIAADVRQIRIELESTLALFLTTDSASAYPVDTAALLARARATRYAPVISEAMLVAGIDAMLGERGDAACDAVSAAISDADVIGYHRLFLEGLLLQAECLRGAIGTAARVLPRLEAGARRSGHPLLIAETEGALAIEANRNARFDEAIERIARSAAAYRDHELDTWTARAIASEGQFRLYRDRGDDLDRAAELLRSVLDADIDHDFVVRLLHEVESRRGRAADAPALPAADTEVDLKSAVTISLTVTDQGTPVAGATITAGRQVTSDVDRVRTEVGGVVTAVTGADGTVVVAVPLGSVILVRSGARAGVVEARRSAGPQQIALGPTAEVSGIVRGLDPAQPDPDDDKARVRRRYLPTVYLHTWPNPDSSRTLSWEVPVDNTGRWRATGVVPGEYMVSAQARSGLRDLQAHIAELVVEPGTATVTAPELAFEPSPYAVTVVQPAGLSANFVIAFPGATMPPSSWKELGVLLQDATAVSLAYFRDPAAEDKVEPGETIARLASGAPGTVICSMPGVWQMEHEALTMFQFGTDENPPHCVSLVTRVVQRTTLSR